MPETIWSPENTTFPASKSGDSLVAVQATFVVCVSPLYTAVLGVPAMATSIIAFVIVKAASVTVKDAVTLSSS